MKKIIDSVKESWMHCILSMLIFSGVVFKNNPFFNVGVALVWCLIVLAVTMSTLNVNFVKILNLSRGEAREGLITYAKRINNQTNFSKMLNKVLICIEFVSLAYCGWIATGIIFLITIFVMKMSVKFLASTVMVNKFCRRSKRHFLVHDIFDVALNNQSLNGVDNNCKTEYNFQLHRQQIDDS